ncbi:MAG: alanine--tRNA ligase [Oscillospiraceae bacterium]|nr:alanine--tRNA ligase [Oscillospiraceae bacterium]
MKFRTVNELREMFLKFFEERGHLRLASGSLVPESDPSLLLINSGMAPLKPYFTGAIAPPAKRAASCQKCIRTPDIDRVGKTSRHATFFEMLGNFSFGDYFKKDACKWAWEFVTETLEIPQDRLYVSVYLEDDEAEEIWISHVGVPAERIVRLGKADNFWEHGVGPCGPCSEIYYDRGESESCGEETCAPGCDCDRFVEFWNLVFTQFDKDDKGNYAPLPKPNIDTGMGLERLAAICQGVDNLFEIDTVRAILDAVAAKAGIGYKKNDKFDVSLRVIADHIRGTVFMIGDGVAPSNEGRGYVLRRLLRRAARHGRLLGIDGAFLADIARVVIEYNKDAYPELAEKETYILKIIGLEEERFSQTIEQGMEILKGFITKRIATAQNVFNLYDTYGFPFDLTKEILAEAGILADEEGFNKLMNEQRERARAARGNDSSWDAEVGQGEKKEENEAESRAHSATHLLQAALRKVLGDHVFQKGSFVGEDRLRFDFSHFEAMTAEQLREVEEEVNRNILMATPSDIRVMTLNEAKGMGAMALFGEKYGAEVRVVKLADSIEFCGGKHVSNTGKIGLFHINGESGSAAGVRRIDASVGLGILGIITGIKTEASEKTLHLQNEIKELQKEMKRLKSSSFSVPQEITKEVNGIMVSIVKLETSDVNALEQVADSVKVKNLTSVVAVGGADKEEIKFVVAATDSAVEKGAHAGNIIREIAEICGGRGGGKPTFAQAGAPDASKLQEALDKVFELV